MRTSSWRVTRYRICSDLRARERHENSCPQRPSARLQPDLETAAYRWHVCPSALKSLSLLADANGGQVAAILLQEASWGGIRATHERGDDAEEAHPFPGFPMATPGRLKNELIPPEPPSRVGCSRLRVV